LREDVAEVLGFGEGGDAGDREGEAHLQRGFGQAGAGGEAVHDASIGLAGHAFGQDRLHVRICVAGMDDQRQAGFLRGLDMDAEAGLLDGFRIRRVVVVEAGLADADKARVAGEGRQVRRRSTSGSSCGAHRVDAGGVEDLGVGLGQARTRGSFFRRVQIVTIRFTPAARARAMIASVSWMRSGKSR
jgi:hypothetical protein